MWKACCEWWYFVKHSQLKVLEKFPFLCCEWWYFAKHSQPEENRNEMKVTVNGGILQSIHNLKYHFQRLPIAVNGGILHSIHNLFDNINIVENCEWWYFT